MYLPDQKKKGMLYRRRSQDSIHFYIFQRILLVSVIAVVVGIEHERRVVELAALLQLVQQPVHTTSRSISPA